MFTESHEHYERRIRTAVAALTNADSGAAELLAERDRDVVGHRVFAEGNRVKRGLKLRAQLGLLESLELFPDLKQLICRFTQECPQRAHDRVVDDAQRMLAWLPTAVVLSPAQADAIRLQRAENRLEQIARANIVRHRHFQEVLSVVDSVIPLLDVRQFVTLMVNPVLVCVRLSAPAPWLPPNVDLPVHVAVYPRRDAAEKSVLAVDAIEHLRALSSVAPCTIEDCEETLGMPPEQLRAVVVEFAARGLVALR